MSAIRADLCKHVNLLDSLLDAIVRLDGDALVMHVGEKPYVVTTSEAMNQFRGPLAWGQVELSTRVLTSDAVAGMLGQILPLDQRVALEEYGATEYEVAAANHPEERFTVVAARGGDDIWVEMRRQPNLSAEATAAIAELRDEPPVSPVEESVAQDDETPVLAADDSLAEEPADDIEMPELLGAAESDIPADEAEVEVEVRVPILTETHRLDEHSPVEEVTLLSEVEEVSAPADEPEPLPVALIAIHDMAPEEPPVRHDHPGSDADEPISFDIDSDRDLAEELLTLDADFEGGMLANAQGWNDDVMTEGDLGELLRATAAAVIAGEINHDDEAPLAAVAAADAALAAQFEARSRRRGARHHHRRLCVRRTSRRQRYRGSACGRRVARTRGVSTTGSRASGRSPTRASSDSTLKRPVLRRSRLHSWFPRWSTRPCR